MRLKRGNSVDIYPSGPLERLETEGVAVHGFTTGSGSACGKTILLGEHFVVYGAPAIAMPVLGLRMQVELTPCSGAEHDVTALPEGLRSNAKSTLVQGLHVLNLPPQAFRVRVQSSIPIGCGAGSSAAFCVSVVRALGSTAGLRLDNEQVNAAAFALEKAFHGTPSGIDNTVVALERAVWFQHNHPMQKIEFPTLMHWILVDSGQRGSTGVAVADVRRQRTERPEQFAAMMEASRKDANEVLDALVAGNGHLLGRCMGRAHGRLQALKLSTERMESLRERMVEWGAEGVKLTGSGLGGCLLGLFPTGETATAAERSLHQAGYPAWKFTTGEET